MLKRGLTKIQRIQRQPYIIVRFLALTPRPGNVETFSEHWLRFRVDFDE